MEYIINKNQDKIILRSFLKKELALSSRLIRSLKKYRNSILVNGEHADVTKILNENDVVFLDFSDKPEDVNEYLEMKDIPVDVLYEDENYTVVNKPSNMPTHQSLRHKDDTLANALAYRYRSRPYVFRAINRLDRDTSGIVVTANNKFFADILCEKLQNGGFHKSYIAIVEGRTDDEGEIEIPIKRAKESLIERTVADDGEWALTRYKTIISSDEASVLCVTPVTGRTHQIRVHMSAIGHPIIGDYIYGAESPLIPRQALHAYSLSIDGIGEFKSEIPDDMKLVIRRYFGDDASIS